MFWNCRQQEPDPFPGDQPRLAGAGVLLCAVIGLWLQTGLALGATPPASEFYLALYNLIYIIPLLLILLVFIWTLGSRKLQEREGRVLKLGSGNMMWLLGLMLLFYPQGLSHSRIALLLLLVAVALTGIIVWIEQRQAAKGSG